MSRTREKMQRRGKRAQSNTTLYLLGCAANAKVLLDGIAELESGRSIESGL
jgi:hypothetical protein